MSDHESEREEQGTVAQRGRWRGLSIAAGAAAAALISAFVFTPAGHRMLADVPGLAAAAAAPLDDGGTPGFGPGPDFPPGPPPAPGWRSGLFDGLVGAVVEMRADRAVRHLSIEIDATTEQQEKLRTVVRDAIKDLLPVREKILAARMKARDLLTSQTVDRAAIEAFRADLMATNETVSKRLFQAVADAAEVLSPEQRRKISDMVAARHARLGHGWGPGPWGHSWAHGGWRN